MLYLSNGGENYPFSFVEIVDIVFTGNGKNAVENGIQKFKKKYKIRESERIKSFPGMTWEDSADQITLHFHTKMKRF